MTFGSEQRTNTCVGGGTLRGISTHTRGSKIGIVSQCDEDKEDTLCRATRGQQMSSLNYVYSSCC